MPLFLSLLVLIFSFSQIATASESYLVTLKDAERQAVQKSAKIHAKESGFRASQELALAQRAALIPKLSLNGTYQYQTTLPKTQFVGSGTRDSYRVGPVLTFNLWDFMATQNQYRSVRFLSDAKLEEQHLTEAQVRLELRLAYLRLQLALDDLQLIHNSLELTEAQNKDVESKFKAGAATRLDRVASERELFGDQLQLEQKKAEAQSSFMDLLAITQDDNKYSGQRVGLNGLPATDVFISVDSIEMSLKAAARSEFDENLPMHSSLKILDLQAQASDRVASALQSGGYPTVTASAAALLQYPNGISATSMKQGLLGVTVSMPMFEAGRSSHLAEQKRIEADSIRFLQDDTRMELQRNYSKAKDRLKSLAVQRKIIAAEVDRAQEAARLFYQSYKGGKLNFTEVLAANNRAHLAEANAEHILGQYLSQYYELQYLSGDSIR